jgi:hypothetical protein
MMTPPKAPTSATDVQPDVPRRGTDGLKEDLARQLTLMAKRAAPYRKLVPIFVQLLEDPEYGPVLQSHLQRAWKSREFRAYYERPLLLFATLRFDALSDGASHPLHRALRDEDPELDAITVDSMKSALDGSRTGLWTTLRLRRVQTNDTSRALAWMWPAAIAGCSGGGRPLVLVDVGCSAGLNLIGDTLPHIWTTTAGAPLQVVEKPSVAGRYGLDERPLEVTRDDDALWLRACIWPGDAGRLLRLDAALRSFRAARTRGERIEVQKRDATSAAPFVRTVAAAAPKNALTIVYQTMMAGYLDAASRASFEGGLDGLVVSSPPRSLLWVDLEVTGPATSPRPAELWVHARVGDARASFLLGTMGYHPAEVSVREEAVRELGALMRPGR